MNREPDDKRIIATHQTVERFLNLSKTRECIKAFAVSAKFA